ncbi:hypothetical protein [Streptomyces sp. CA-106131]|uniref:hypothetical protein n=1 Tax=Streptomyces sp. CA-106131 TaxID=3240045 RepID=UPI003D903F3E
MLEAHLVQPEVVMQVALDLARDSAGRWRHPARPHHVRTKRRLRYWKTAWMPRQLRPGHIR